MHIVTTQLSSRTRDIGARARAMVTMATLTRVKHAPAAAAVDTAAAAAVKGAARALALRFFVGAGKRLALQFVLTHAMAYVALRFDLRPEESVRDGYREAWGNVHASHPHGYSSSAAAAAAAALTRPFHPAPPPTYEPCVHQSY